MLKLTQENKIVDLPDLNRFQIGDQVVVDASADFDRFEGEIIGIELRRMHGSTYLVPSITLLHDGCITDEFRPNHCRKVEMSQPATCPSCGGTGHYGEIPVNVRDQLRSALVAAVETIQDYLAYTHDGDPYVEDARTMGEMDINDYGRDGRLAYALDLLSNPPPSPRERP